MHGIGALKIARTKGRSGHGKGAMEGSVKALEHVQRVREAEQVASLVALEQYAQPGSRHHLPGQCPCSLMSGVIRCPIPGSASGAVVVSVPAPAAALPDAVAPAFPAP